MLVSKYREIIDDFQKEIIRRKRKLSPRQKRAIPFRTELHDRYERDVFNVPLELLRYRKENGRICSSVMTYEKQVGTLQDKNPKAQEILAKFLREKDPEKTEELKKLIFSEGQREPAVITCDGFLINGNRRRAALEELKEQYPDRKDFGVMKVVILPGDGDEGGKPTLKEIEEIENRYQLQTEGKAEYYGFDTALAIRNKIERGYTLIEQLKDNPLHANTTEKQFARILKKTEEEFLLPLKCVDRYLCAFERDGNYSWISKGLGDKRGRWEAFKDYSSKFWEKAKKPAELDKMGLEEKEIGEIEQAAFKIIRLRELPSNIGKLHMVMRSLPKLCKVAKEELIELNKRVDNEIPNEERFDEQGNRLSPEIIEHKWRSRSNQHISYHVSRAKRELDRTDEETKPLNLLNDALKKLKHENMDVQNMKSDDLKEALKISNEIQIEIKKISSEIFKRTKNKK